MKDALFDSIAAGSDFEVGSPHWLIRRLQDRSNRAFKRLLGIFGKGRKFGFLFALSLLSLIFLSFELRNSAQFSGSPEGRFIFLAYARSSLPALFVLFLYAVLDLCGLEKLRKPRAGPAVLMLLALLVWYTWRKALSVFLMESFFVALVILLLLVLDWLQTRRADRRLRFSTVLGSFLGLLLLWWLMVAFLADRATVRILSIAPEKFLFPVVVFWSEATDFLQPRRLFTRDRIWQLLHPVNQTLPLPLASSLFKPAPVARRHQLRLQGLVDIAIASLSTIVAFAIEVQVFGPMTESTRGFPRLLELGFLYYVLLFLKSFSYFRLVVGVGRCLDLELYNPFNFALLASTPMERWSRWSTYYYRWIRDFAYFPVVARRRSVLLGLIAAFGLSFFLHTFRYAYRVGGQELLTDHIFHFRSNLVYYTLQMLVIYLSYLTLRLWPSGKRRTGWFGVLATLGLMTWVHFWVWVTR